MGLISYNLGIPSGPNNPSNDQPNLLINNDNVATALAVDHVPFNVANTGYHTVIHQVPNGGLIPVDPPIVAGFGQLYAKNVTVGVNTDTQLFFKTGLGGVSQITGNFATANGWQQLGGVLLQWGSITGTPIANGQTVNFTRNFTSVFSITLGTTSNSTSDKTINILTGSVTNSGFQVSTSATSLFQTVYYMAIGISWGQN